MSIKAGVVGLGKMGKLHLMNAKFIDDVKVTAVADASEKKPYVGEVAGNHRFI